MTATHRKHLSKSLISMSFYLSILMINCCPRSPPHLKIKAPDNELHSFQSTHLQDELKRRAIWKALAEIEIRILVKSDRLLESTRKGHKHATQLASIRQNKEVSMHARPNEELSWTGFLG